MRASTLHATWVLIIILILLVSPAYGEDCGCGGGDDGLSSGDSSDSGSSSGYGSEGDPAAFASQARELFSQGKTEDALEALNTSLALDPYNTQAFMGKGEALFSLQRYPEAIAAFQAVLSLSPSNDEAYAKLGNTYLVMKEYEKAAEAYERALGMRPGNTLAAENLAVALRNLEGTDSPPTPSPDVTKESGYTTTTIATGSPEMTAVQTMATTVTTAPHLTPATTPSAMFGGGIVMLALVLAPAILIMGRGKY